MEVELAEVRQTFETNLFAVITMCQTFLPLLIKAKGTIVQIGSVAGVSLRGIPFFADLISLTITRSSHMYSALSTTPPKQHCTRSVTRFAWSWLHSGSLKYSPQNFKIVMLCFSNKDQQRSCHNHRYRRCSIAYCAYRPFSAAGFFVFPYRERVSYPCEA